MCVHTHSESEREGGGGGRIQRILLARQHKKVPSDLDSGVRAIELGFNMLGPSGKHTGNVVAAVHARFPQRSHLASYFVSGVVLSHPCSLMHRVE
jgi:hypothetical protein